MAIPLSTSTIDVTRTVVATSTQDPYDPPEDQPSPAITMVAMGVNAVIDPPSASVDVSTGFRDVYTSTLHCDTIPGLQVDDMVIDSATGTAWRVMWVNQVNAVGLSFTTAQLRMTTGYTA